MTKTKKPITEVKLWKDNQVSGEFTIPIAKFKKQFFQWVKKQDKQWCSYYGSRTAVNEFIGKELNSVADFDPKKGIDVYTDLSELVRDEFWRIVENELI